MKKIFCFVLTIVLIWFVVFAWKLCDYWKGC